MPRLNDGRPATIAIVGGGFSGAMVAVQLGRLAGPRPPRIALFEKGDRLARGIAYGTRSDAHLLNVPAGLMSALPDEPAHFLDWLRARDPDAHHGTFAPRRVYGDYLEGLLHDGPARVDSERAEVVDLDVLGGPGGVRLRTRAGKGFVADRVVLALGHRPPQDPAPCEGAVGPAEYVRDPWSPDALDGHAPDDPIALIGSGLSAIDLAVEARSRGHRGTIYAISRHGLLPCRHAASPPVPRPHFAPTDPGAPPTARAILRRVRSEASACRSEGGDWRSVIDGLRPVTQALWGSLDVDERRRFVRHGPRAGRSIATGSPRRSTTPSRRRDATASSRSSPGACSDWVDEAAGSRSACFAGGRPRPRCSPSPGRSTARGRPATSAPPRRISCGP